jgi:hypothetical protein
MYLKNMGIVILLIVNLGLCFVVMLLLGAVLWDMNKEPERRRRL